MTNTLRYRTSNDFLVPIGGCVFSKNGPTAIAPRRISIGFEGTKEELLEQMRVRAILGHLHISKSLENGWKIWKSLEILGNIVRISDKTGGNVFCGNRFLMIMNSKGDLRGGQITLGSVCCCPVLRDGNDAKFAAVQELSDVFLEAKKIHDDIPIGSMYSICANIWAILMVNVTIYGIHGSYGIP